MDVEEEAQGCPGDPLGAFHGADVDVFAGAGHVRAGHRGAVHQQCSGLGERDAEGLDDMAEGR